MWVWPSRLSTAWWDDKMNKPNPCIFLHQTEKTAPPSLFNESRGYTSKSIWLGCILILSSPADQEASTASCESSGECWRRSIKLHLQAELHHLPQLHLQPCQQRNQGEHPLPGRAQNGTNPFPNTSDWCPCAADRYCLRKCIKTDHIKLNIALLPLSR